MQFIEEFIDEYKGIKYKIKTYQDKKDKNHFAAYIINPYNTKYIHTFEMILTKNYTEFIKKLIREIEGVYMEDKYYGFA